MDLHSRRGTVLGGGISRMAVLLALFVGAAALFASLAAQDAHARGSSSSSGSKSSSSSSSSGSKAGSYSSSKSKSGSSSGSGVKHKAYKDFDCDEDDGCATDEQAGQSDGGSMAGWLVVGVVLLVMVGVVVVGVGTVGYVGWRFYRGMALRGDRPLR